VAGLGSVVTILRRASRTGWRFLKSVPRRVGNVVSLGALGPVATPLVGLAVIVAALTYFGVV
jgi:hypothetical protein